MSNDTQSKENPNKIKPTLKIILDYYKWEQDKENLLKEKINEKKNLYALNKKMIEDWKSNIQYEQLKVELQKKGKEYKVKVDDIVDFLKNENIKFDSINLKEIDIDSMIKNPDKSEKNNTEKFYKNPLLNEDEIELVNNDINEFFKQFHKENWVIQVECEIKDGKYCLAYTNEVDNKPKKEDEKPKEKKLDANNEKEEQQKNENSNQNVEKNGDKNEKRRQKDDGDQTPKKPIMRLRKCVYIIYPNNSISRAANIL